ncbi:Spy/CpxP family protein refolding chaperone [Polyangium spumosum]|nr:Spy/CpxP family protein refolding chaperone [Polyangium spumosum]
MFGFLIGTACLIGLIKVLRHGGCHRGYGYRSFGYAGGCGSYGGDGCGHGYGHGGWEGGGHGREQGGPFRTHGRAGFRPRGYGMPHFVLRRLFEALDTTPGQEKAIAAAMEEMREVMAKHRGELRKSREDLARVMRSPSFDETVMGELFARHDAALEVMRKATVGSMAKVHEVLDERQRARLADLIEQGPGFWGGFGG